MAEYSAVPSFADIRLQRSYIQRSHFIPKNLGVRTVQSVYKKQFLEDWKVVRFSSREVIDFSQSTASTLGGRLRAKRSSWRYCSFGTIMNPEIATYPNWIASVDQLLMMVSIVLAYAAGVVPFNKAYIISGKMSDKDAVPANTLSGSVAKSDFQVDIEFIWDEVRRKLLGVLDAVQHDGSLNSRVAGYEKYSTKCPLSLYAIAEGPRLRLLWATLQQLEKEVNNISGSLQNADRDGWLVISSETMEKSCQPVCVAWLEEELNLKNKKHEKEVFSTITKKLKMEESILKNIQTSGKEDLYADFLFALRFHSPRVDCLYESKLLASHGIDILEDLVIGLAEGITSHYLELISVDSNMSSEMSRLGLILCSLSTRAIQKLRNEVALKQWVGQNMESVVSMYEDRFELLTFILQPTEVGTESEVGKVNWWKKLWLVKPACSSSSHHVVVINELSMSVRRTKELRALNGWRYYFSLFLELSDIAMPMVRRVFEKMRSGISFLLVCLIGRSLGLIYSGIRQSLGWR